jgi:hypothetical protein
VRGPKIFNVRPDVKIGAYIVSVPKICFTESEVVLDDSKYSQSEREREKRG